MRELELILQFKYKFSSIRPLIWRHAIAKGHFVCHYKLLNERLHTVKDLTATTTVSTRRGLSICRRKQKERVISSEKNLKKLQSHIFVVCEFVYVASDCCIAAAAAVGFLFLNISCVNASTASFQYTCSDPQPHNT